MSEKAESIRAALAQNSDDYFSDRIDFATFSERNGAIWDRAIAEGLRDAVCAILNAEHYGRRERPQ